MISTDHINAEYYFNRDVNCVRTFFRRRFGFVASAVPMLHVDTSREDVDLDEELRASGWNSAGKEGADFSAMMTLVEEEDARRVAAGEEEGEEEEEEEEDDDDDDDDELSGGSEVEDADAAAARAEEDPAVVAAAELTADAVMAALAQCVAADDDVGVETPAIPAPDNRSRRPRGHATLPLTQPVAQAAALTPLSQVGGAALQACATGGAEAETASVAGSHAASVARRALAMRSAVPAADVSERVKRELGRTKAIKGTRNESKDRDKRKQAVQIKNEANGTSGW